jgi:hypothetical protein
MSATVSGGFGGTQQTANTTAVIASETGADVSAVSTGSANEVELVSFYQGPGAGEPGRLQRNDHLDDLRVALRRRPGRADRIRLRLQPGETAHEPARIRHRHLQRFVDDVVSVWCDPERHADGRPPNPCGATR